MTPDGIEDAFEVSSGICNSPINKPAPVVVVSIENLLNFIQQIVVFKLLVSYSIKFKLISREATAPFSAGINAL